MRQFFAHLPSLAPHARMGTALLWFCLMLALLGVLQGFASDTISRDLVYNADALYLPALYADLFSPYPLSGWKLTPSPYFFPDMAVYFLLNFLLRSMHLAIMAFAILQGIAYIAALLWLARVVSPDHHRAMSRLLLWLGSLFFLLVSTGRYSMFMPALQSAHHFGAAIAQIVSLALAVSILRETGHTGSAIWQSGLLIGVIALAGPSDSVYLAQTLLPLLVTFGAAWLLGDIRLKRLLTLTAASVGAVGIGDAVKFHLTPSVRVSVFGNPTLARTLKAWDGIRPWAAQFITQHPILATLWLLFVASSAICVGRAVLQKIRHKDATVSSAWLFVQIFMLVSLLGNLGAALFSGFSSSRYFLPTLMLPIFFGWPFLLSGTRAARLMRARYCAPALIGVFVVAAIWAGAPFAAPLARLAALADYYPADVQCFDDHTARHQVRYGISEYWDAKRLSLLSKRGLHVVQAKQLYNNSLFPQHWINNIAWYRHDFSFIITQIAQDTSLVLEPEYVIRRFGAPAASFTCAGKTALVYNREQDALFQQQFQVLPAFAEFKQPGDQYDFYACYFVAAIGETVGLSRVATEHADGAGLLVANAGLPLPDGRYRMTLHYYADSPSADAIGRWFLLHEAESGDKRVVAGNTLTTGKGALSHDVAMPATGELRLRVEFDGNGTLLVNRLNVEKLE